MSCYGRIYRERTHIPNWVQTMALSLVELQALNSFTLKPLL